MKKSLLLLMAVCFYSLSGIGQISGLKSIPGDYSSVAAAISALNASGVGTGGVTFNVAAGHSETFANLTDGLISATGTQANPVIFQKSGAGNNPLITAATPGTGAIDYIICFEGGDYFTFDGIDIQDNPANNTATQQMEFGFALRKALITLVTDGAQHNTLKNCTISLKTNENAFGISLESKTPAGSNVSVSALSGTNSYNKFYSITFNNCYGGISLNGYNDASPFALFDQANEIGVGGGNFFTYSGLQGASNNSMGIYATYQNDLEIANNNFSGSVEMPVNVRYYAARLIDAENANLNIYNNKITMACSGAGYFNGFVIDGMGKNGTNNTLNFYDNQIVNNSFLTHQGGNVNYAYINTGAVNANCYNNEITGNSIGSNTANSTGSVTYLYFSSLPSVVSNSVMNCHNNTVSNNTRS